MKTSIQIVIGVLHVHSRTIFFLSLQYGLYIKEWMDRGFFIYRHRADYVLRASRRIKCVSNV